MLHGLISGFFLACIARVLVDAERRRVSRTTVAAVGALAAEGLLVGLSGGDCPLGPFFRRRARTLRPFLVAMRSKKPCTRLRRRLCGWYVRFIDRGFP